MDGLWVVLLETWKEKGQGRRPCLMDRFSFLNIFFLWPFCNPKTLNPLVAALLRNRCFAPGRGLQGPQPLGQRGVQGGRDDAQRSLEAGHRSGDLEQSGGWNRGGWKKRCPHPQSLPQPHSLCSSNKDPCQANPPTQPTGPTGPHLSSHTTDALRTLRSSSWVLCRRSTSRWANPSRPSRQRRTECGCGCWGMLRGVRA